MLNAKMPKSVLKQNGKRCVGQPNDNDRTAKKLKVGQDVDFSPALFPAQSNTSKLKSTTPQSTASCNLKECVKRSKRHAKETESSKGRQVRSNVLKNKGLVEPKQNDVLKNRHTRQGKTTTPGELFWLLFRFTFDFFVKYRPYVQLSVCCNQSTFSITGRQNTLVFYTTFASEFDFGYVLMTACWDDCSFTPSSTGSAARN